MKVCVNFIIIFWQQFGRTISISFLIMGLCIATATQADSSQFVKNANLPSDVYDRCVVTKKAMAKWFDKKRITNRGWVKPADSTKPIFKPGNYNSRCDFYKWGAQMFLWLTSETGGKDKHLFSQAPIFYDISTINNDRGKRDFVADNGSMSLEPGAKSEIEFGEASHNEVLITKDGTVVYFGLHANNVFALYTTGINQNWFTSTSTLSNQFPNTVSDLNDLKRAAKRHPEYARYLPLRSDEALAMELKTSWVDATGWSTDKLKRYISSDAIVPVFDTSASKGPWPITSSEKKTLAMIGMHVVGTVNGHPEMVWATFEHVDNAPANTYTYDINNNNPRSTNTKPYNASTNDWTLKASDQNPPTEINATAQEVLCVVNQSPTLEQLEKHTNIKRCAPNASGKTGSISSQIVRMECANEIDSVEVARMHAWGGGTTANNTDLISLNKSILTWLAPGDYRGNYIQTGAIWTSDGSIPTNGDKSKNPKLVGSLKLANTTMETYDQLQNGENYYPINCFGCHNATSPSKDYSISHIIDAMNSLPQKN